MFEISKQQMNIGSGDEVAESGEVHALHFVLKSTRAPAPSVVFDVGANRGDYAAQAINVLGANTRLYIFEPSKVHYSSLQKRFPDALVCEFGFGTFEGTRTLYYDKEGSGLASLYNRNLDWAGIRMDGQETVAVRTIDNFCLENRIAHINLLKLDVEGAELEALRGATKMISSDSIDFVQFEFGGCNIDSRTFFRDFFDLLSSKYVLNRILVDGLLPITRYHEKYEIFATTNYLAVNRSLLSQL